MLDRSGLEERRDIPRGVEHPDDFDPILEGPVKNHTGTYSKAAERAHARGRQIQHRGAERRVRRCRAWIRWREEHSAIKRPQALPRAFRKGCLVSAISPGRV